jgi:uncharacterized protein (TIGR02145 family)
VDCSAIGWTGTNAGGKMKSTSNLWNSPNTGATNSSGFSAIANGSRSTTGSFNPLSGTAFWTVNNGTLIGNSIYRSIDYNSAQLYRNETEKIRGYTIRCLKD